MNDRNEHDNEYSHHEHETDISAFGKFSRRREVVRALQELEANGIPRRELGVLLPDFDVQGTDFGASEPHKVAVSAELGAAVGVMAGAAVGVLVFLVPGLFAPGGFPMVLTLSGFAFTLLLGAVTGALVGLRLSKTISRKYLAGRNEHGILVTVHTPEPDQASRAKEVLARNGAREVALTSENPGWREIFSNWEKVDIRNWLKPRHLGWK
ncbi:MAG: hypothetical protein AB7G93_05150 [Bdellovibrionales bacterium]